MNRTARLIASIGLGLVLTAAAQATEKKVKQANLPSAVQKTAEQESAGATISGYTKDTVEGETIYQMALVVDGKAREVSIGADGNVVSTQQEISWDAVPADVQSTFTKAAGKGTLGGFRSVSTNGKIVSYNAMLDTKGVKDRVSVKPHVVTDGGAAPVPGTNSKK
jgi:hypothetical protein